MLTAGTPNAYRITAGYISDGISPTIAYPRVPNANNRQVAVAPILIPNLSVDHPMIRFVTIRDTEISEEMNVAIVGEFPAMISVGIP